jgi:RND family efflux transporter MFP subunit
MLAEPRSANLPARCLPAVALVLGTVLAGCASHEARQTHAAESPVRVTVMRVGVSEAQGQMIVAARVRAREEVSLAAATAANLTALPVVEGGHFARGQILARFDAPETRDALDAAQASLVSANVRLETSRRQENRVDKLFTEKLVSEREIELARDERQAAEADVATARAAIARWSAATVLEAPFVGTVVRHRVDVGTRVQPGQFVLDLRSDRVEIEAPIPESAVEDLARDLVWVQVGSGAWIPARVQRVEGMTDFTSRTRTAFLRPIDAAITLEPGAYARVRIASTTGQLAAATEPGAMLIPVRSLVHRGALTGVYVVREGRAELRWLKPGRALGDSVEVLAGLWSGEDVALDPRDLADGRPVEAER